MIFHDIRLFFIPNIFHYKILQYNIPNIFHI